MDSTAGLGHLPVDIEGPSGSGAEGFEVEPEKLTEVADVISAQADALGEKVRGRLEALRVESPSADIVSRHAVDGWNTLTVDGDGSYAQRVLSYVDRLHGLAERLRAAGAEYDAGEHDNVVAVSRTATGN